MRPEDLMRCIKKHNLKKIKAIITMYNGGAPNNAEEFFKLKKNIISILLRMLVML